MKAHASILIIEDEDHIAEGVQEVLELEGYATQIRRTGPQGLDALKMQAFDMALLDVMLPGMDGFEVCKAARAAGVHTPILFLTARGAIDDRLRGLQAGGDDYLPKPFHLKELLLRVSAILRRTPNPQSTPEPALFSFAGNELDLHSGHGVAFDGSEYRLTEKERKLLKLLSENPNQTITRERVFDEVWGREIRPASRVITAMFTRLQRRFERNFNDPKHLEIVPGVGYRLSQASESQ